MAEEKLGASLISGGPIRDVIREKVILREDIIDPSDRVLGGGVVGAAIGAGLVGGPTIPILSGLGLIAGLFTGSAIAGIHNSIRQSLIKRAEIAR